MEQSLLPNIVTFLQRIAPFNQLPERALDDIAASAEILYLGKGQWLDAPHSAQGFLYIVRTGSVEQRLPDGTLRARLGEEDVFGFSLPAHGEQPEYQAVALENCLLYRFDYAALLESIRDFPQVKKLLARSANSRLQSSVNVKWSEAEKGIFFKPVSAVASSRIAIASPEMSIQQVAQLMRHRTNSSCAVIVEGEKLLGMITDKDMTKRVVAGGVDISQPVTAVMTSRPFTVGQDELVMSAVGLMMRHNIQNLPVLDANKQVVGLITPQQLIQKNSVQAIFLIERIVRCESVHELSQLALERQAIFEAMAEANLPAQLMGQVLTMIYDAFTRQLIVLAERAFGPVPCRFVWLAAGSHARGEIHLGSDQDNALVLEEQATENDRTYFSHFAMYVCKGLAECGYALCTGRFMAATPKWCQPLTVWKQYYHKWAVNPEYDMLLNLTVFLEIRAVAGDNALFDELDAFRLRKMKNNAKMMSALVRNALAIRPPLGIFNNLVLVKNGQNEKSLNIKKAAITCLVDLARIYTLHEGGSAINTEERLAFARQENVINEGSYQDLIGTYRYVTQLRYTHHLQCLRQGLPVSNDIAPDRFGSFERQHLKDAFRIISAFQEMMKMRFGV